GGFAPPDPPTRVLARRFAGSLRPRGSLAALVRVTSCQSAAPTTGGAGGSRAASCRAACGTRCTCASGGRCARPILSGGLRPPDPPARSLAGAPAPRSARVAHSLRSFALPVARRQLRPLVPMPVVEWLAPVLMAERDVLAPQAVDARVRRSDRPVRRLEQDALGFPHVAGRQPPVVLAER